MKEVMKMEELLEILSDLHPDVDFETEESLIDDMILDSFDIVTLISEISENFDVTISAEHIIPENFNSAQALYELIQKLEDEE
jgi:acyl carrier protein